MISIYIGIYGISDGDVLCERQMKQQLIENHLSTYLRVIFKYSDNIQVVRVSVTPRTLHKLSTSRSI